VSLAGLESLLYDSNFGPGGDRTEATTRKFVSAASDRSAGYCREGKDRGSDHEEVDPAERQATAFHGLSPAAMAERGFVDVKGAPVCAKTPPAKITTSTASTVAKLRRDMEPLVVFRQEHYGEVTAIIPRGKSCACCERVRHT
jgi:hypothetical protein